MQGSTVAFEDVYRQIIDVNSNLLAGKIDPSTALASAAGMAALSKNMSNEIKLYQLDLAAGRTPPEIGKRVIFSQANEERPAIEGEAVISDIAAKKIASVVIEPKPEQKERKPKIGIIGLSSPQRGPITEKFAEFADIDFWHDDGQGKLNSLALSSDVIFVNKSQASHKFTQMLDARNAEYILVQPGTTQMISAIKKHFDSKSK